MMEVAFVRVPKVQSEAVVYLDHGRVFRIPTPGGLTHVPPHDLGQFIVEHELGWQTGFWGYIARGVVFREMVQEEGTRPPHGEERSRTAIRGAKDFLAEAECLAGAIANIARSNLDGDGGRMTAMLAKGWWPPHSKGPQLPLADVQRACRAFRQVEAGWRALAIGESLRFRWSLRRNPIAPENPLDLAVAAKRGTRGGGARSGSSRPQRH
jgi:hypothetical protein